MKNNIFSSVSDLKRDLLSLAAKSAEVGILNITTLDYLIAVDYQINVALGIFPEINKRRLLNNCSLGKNLKRLINISLLTSKNMLISLVVYSS